MCACYAVVAVSAGLLSSACAPSSYTEPNAGPLAKVRFISYGDEGNRGGGVTVLRQYDDSDCRTGEREVVSFSASSHFYTRNHKRIGMPMDYPHLSEAQKTEVLVRANQPFYGIFSAWEVDQSCNVAFSFLPKDSGNYEVSLRWNYRVGSCNATLSTLDGASSPSSIALPYGQCAQALEKTHLY